MRHPSVDVQRTIAIALMVLVHFVENLAGQGKYPWLPAGLAAPSFLLLLGVSQQLSFAAQHRRGVPAELQAKRGVRRGLCLLGLGFTFNLLVWLPEDLFNWDVLTLAGLALLALVALRRLPEPVLWVLVLLLFAGAPVLRHLAHYDEFWTQGYFDPDLTLTEVLTGAFVTGYFPLFPWLLVPLVGWLVAPRLYPPEPADGAARLSTPPTLAEQTGAEARVSLRNVLLGGGLAWLLSMILTACRGWFPPRIQQRLVTGWTMCPPSVSYLLGTVGLAVVVLATLRWWLELRPQATEPGRFVKTCGVLSRHSLSIYVLHHVVHIWPMWLWATWQGLEATIYWQQALSMPAAVAAAVGFLALCAWLFPKLEQAGIPTLETALRWL
ncbi:MAG: heparan-alpha-glucosaminide N-acetyltransferase domain-containing protein, partial [Planctomycetaceae bacterium]